MKMEPQKYKLADIKLGYSCNNNCMHCIVADNRRYLTSKGLNLDLDTDEVKNQMRSAVQNGAKVVVITGGEPTVRKDILELVEYAKSLDFVIQMQTNGRMFYYRKFARKISRIAPVHYAIALHGHNARIHDSITRVKGSFEQTVEGIKNLMEFKKLGQFVTGKIVISKLNMKHLSKIIDLYTELGIKNSNVAFPHGGGNAWLYFDDVVPTYTELKSYLISMIKSCNKHKITVDIETVPFCFLKGYEKHSSELYRAKEIEIRTMEAFTPDFMKMRKDFMKKKPRVCGRCKFDLICEGPWKEYIERFGSSEFKPVAGKKIETVRELLSRK